MFRKLAVSSVLVISCLLGSTQFSSAFRIVQISDCHILTTGEHTASLQAVIKEVNESPIRPDLVLSTGDYADSGTADQYALYKSLVSKFDMPVHEALGNHEVRWSSWGKTGSERFLHEKTYYSFDHKGVHFVSLDSTVWLEHNSFIDPLELKWLKNDLRKVVKTRPVILFYHHCPGYLMNESELFDVVKPYNVKLALVGHEHTWGTSVRNGIHFELAAACYEGSGNYRIVDIDEKQILTMKKEVGKNPVLDETISTAPTANPIKLTSSKAVTSTEGEIVASATSDIPISKIDIALDGKYVSTLRGPDGEFHATFSGVIPGKHVITARGTDSTGAEWVQSDGVVSGDTFREAWRFSANGGVQREVAVGGGVAYFGTTGGQVYCVNTAGGQQVWKADVGSAVISRIAVDSAAVYVGTARGDFLALSLKDGSRIWRTNLNSPIEGSPVVSDSVVYVSNGEGVLFALSASTGRELWHLDTGDMVQSTPLLLGESLYLGNWDEKFMKVARKTGQPDWTLKVGGWKGYSPAACNPSTDGSRVFYTAIPWEKNDPDIVAVDAENGKKVWGYQTAGDEGGCGVISPCVSGNGVSVLTYSGKLMRFDSRDGRVLWEARTGHVAFSASPAAGNEKIFTCGVDGVVSAFEETTGKLLWSYSSGRGYVFGNPVYADGSVYISFLDGSVVCLRADSAK